MAVLGVRGRLCQVGIHPAPRTVDMHRVFWRELEVLGARLYTREDWEQAVALVASGRVPVDALVSAVVPLADVADALRPALPPAAWSRCSSTAARAAPAA